MSISKRLKGPTPVFFKKLRTWIISLSTGLAGLGAAIVIIPNIVSSAIGRTIEFPILVQIGVYCMVIGGICGGLGTFLTSLPLETSPEAKEAVKEEVVEVVKTALDDNLNKDV